MAITFRKATKQQSKLRLSLIGPSGSGKTYSALAIATHLAKPIAVIDTERGSASKYADLFDFQVLELETFGPQMYIDAIAAAVKAGFGTVVIDSLSHAWMGKGGALELVDNAAKRSQSKNSFQAWRDVTPLHNALVDAIITARVHIIATMRAKTEYVMEKDERTGKTAPKKIGIQPVQRDGLEYEFDVVADLNLENEMIIGKTRLPALKDKIFTRPGKDVADIMNAWLMSGEAVPEPTAEETAPASDAKPTETQPVASEAKEANPEQAARLNSLLARLDKAKFQELESITADAKESLKGDYLTRYRTEYTAVFKKLNAAKRGAA